MILSIMVGTAVELRRANGSSISAAGSAIRGTQASGDGFYGTSEHFTTTSCTRISERATRCPASQAVVTSEGRDERGTPGDASVTLFNFFSGIGEGTTCKITRQ